MGTRDDEYDYLFKGLLFYSYHQFGALFHGPMTDSISSVCKNCKFCKGDLTWTSYAHFNGRLKYRRF